MSRPIYEPSLPRKDSDLSYGNRQLFRRPAPVTGPTTDVVYWAQLMDGFSSTTWPTGTWLPVDFDYAAKYDPDDYYFAWTTTQSGTTGDFRFELELVQDGIYLVDCVLGLNVTGSAADGLVNLDVQPSQSSFIEYMVSGGSSEQLSMRESKMWSALTLNSMLRAHVVWSNREGTLLQPRARQETGVNRTMGGRYLKAVWLGEHGDFADWTIEDLF